MLFTEWNWDDALAVRFEEGREERDIEVARPQSSCAPGQGQVY
jgi:hypothetical protein